MIRSLFARAAALNAVIAMALSSPVAAQPQPAVLALMPYMEGTAACFDAAETEEEAQICVGKGATLCMDGEQDGYSTVGMMFCLLAEYEAWDRLLNQEYGPALRGVAAMDEQEAQFFDGYSDREEWLRKAQRAWIPFRDAECALAYAMWGSGSMRQIAGAQCLRDITAERAIYIKFLGSNQR